MPLIACPACQKDVSSQAPTCPHCGHPIATDANNQNRTTRGGLWRSLNKDIGPRLEENYRGQPILLFSSS